MIRNYDIKVENVHTYNEFVGVEDLHPYVTVIHYDELSPIRHCRVAWSIYGVFLLNDCSEQLSYGSGTYDYKIGDIVCVSPSQIGGRTDDGSTFQRKGWALLFDPALFHGTDYEAQIKRMEFFQYHINKALSITALEQQNLELLFGLLKSELSLEKRVDVVMKLIELLLTYCSSFFKRQHLVTTGVKSGHVVSRLERILDCYYSQGRQFSGGLPTVGFCAEKLCIAPNYLGDLIRKETGDTTIHYIGRYVVRRAKGLLMSGKSIAEVAYMLGFDFPSHFCRLFRRFEGITPSDYLKRI